MELPEQDRQALIEAARRRTQPQQGGAAFGVYPSSGKRPEKLNVSRDVNMPAQAARGWVAGTLGLPGDIESLGRMALNFAFGPGGVNVDETPVLPTSEFYQEYLPGGDERPAAKFASGLGALAGGAGSTKLAGAAVKGAKATGKALGPKAAEMAEGYLQKSGLAPTVVKPKGGNWLSGSVEGATEPLKPASDKVVEKSIESSRERLANMEQAGGRPEALAVEREMLTNLENQNALNQWINSKLNKYIRNEMGTPEDPVRRLAERDVLHFEPVEGPNIPSQAKALANKRLGAGMPAAPIGESVLARRWETLADKAIDPYSAGAYKHGALDESLLTQNPWLEKVPDEAMVYSAKGLQRDLGFDHLIDELRNATRADSDLPANLRWKPEDLKKVTMEQAVERVAKINDWRAAQMEAARKAAREGIPLHKEYEGGFQWMAAPDTAIDPKSLQYIKDVGCEGGWCTQGEDAARRYGGGGNQLYVLHEPSGKPVVQISVKPGKPWNERSGVFHNNPELEDSWRQFAIEASSAEKGNRPTNYIVRYPEWLSKNHPDLYQKYAHVFEKDPPEIVEIKGKQNRAPKEEHLPMVQDFVRSGNWSRVGDFHNTHLVQIDAGSEMANKLEALGEPVPKYVTHKELDELLKKVRKPGEFPSYAKGGLVQDTDAIAAKLTGMDKDKALTHALRMANAKQEAHMGAGGFLTLAKGAKAAKAAEEAAAAAKAAKVAKPVEKTAKPAEKAAEAAKPAVKGPQAEALETARKNAVKMLGLPENNTAMDRAKALGYRSEKFHETTAPRLEQISQQGFNPRKPIAAASDNETPYGVFTKDSGRSIGLARDGEVQLPLLVKTNEGTPAFTAFRDRGDLSSRLGVWNPEISRLQAAQNMDETARAKQIEALGEMLGTRAHPNTSGMTDAEIWKQIDDLATGDTKLSAKTKDLITKELVARGIETVRLAKDAGSMGRSAETTISLNPTNIRSRFAAFDPARVNENDLLGAADPALLAGTAVASGIGLGALGQMSKPKPEQEEKKKAAGGLAKRM